MNPDRNALRELRHEFEDLLYYEAWLLDTDRLEEWLALFADTVRYWAPVRRNLETGTEDVSQQHLLAHFDDDKAGLTLRVRRLRTGSAHAEEPRSRIRHCISNVRILDTDGPQRVKVASNFQVHRSRWQGAEHVFVGCREDWWRRGDEAGEDRGSAWRNEERFILLDHNVLENVTILF